jgi:glycosyltransferase involved in cell wall biosynthesis
VTLASVVVRSYRRPHALLELVERLRIQDHPDFEVVIVEQSDDPELIRRIEALADPRIVLVVRPPLGAPAARNEGVRRARGEILLFIDDDDLPLGDDWISAHLRNYADPSCLGVNGRLSSRPDATAPPRFPRLVRWAAFRHTFLKDPRTLAFGSLRKQGIDFLVGSNVSLRRSAIERAGGWDEGVPMGEEQSFAFKLARARRAGEYLVYDPTPIAWRRVHIDGGLDRRSGADWYLKDLAGRVIYYHGVVGHYFPWRFRLLYPLYVLRTWQQVVAWIWDGDNAGRSLSERLRASLGTLAALPAMEWREGWRRPPEAIRRVRARDA